MSPTMVDRAPERAAIDGLVAATRDGMSGAVVLRGDAGIGKTVLVEYAASLAEGLQLVRTTGVEAEVGYPFAALHRLLVPFAPLVGQLPAPQREALRIAWGLDEGAAADPFIVGLATLSILSEGAGSGPIVVCVDDAQWLDQESLHALAFVARRVHAEGIALVFAYRTGVGDLSALDGVPVIDVAGLGVADGLELLHTVTSRTIDPQLAERVVDATGGNPLALTDLGTDLLAHVNEGAPLVDPLPLGPQLEAHYLDQVRGLPAATQSWLIVAAAESTGDLGCISRAAAELGLPPDASAAAEQAGIVTVRTDVAFRHPLIRSAVHGGSTSAERRGAHLALAAVLTGDDDGDRRAWHRAAASVGPDEEIAAALEQSAARALAKGGFAASADVLSRSADLTPDPAVQARRLVEAADAASRGGAPLQAKGLLDRLERLGERAIGDAGRGRALMVQARVGFQAGEPGAFARASSRCVDAAAALGPVNPVDARAALLQAAEHVITSEHLMVGTTPTAIAAAILASAPPTGEHPEVTATLEAFRATVQDPFETATPRLRTALDMIGAPGRPPEEVLARYLFGVMFCNWTWDSERQAAILRQANAAARSVGALTDLDTILYCQSMVAANDGDLAAADRFLIEGHQMRSALGATADQWEIYRHPELLAWHGLDEQLDAVAQFTLDASITLGNGAVASILEIAKSISHLGRGNYSEARNAAKTVVDREVVCIHTRVFPLLVESALRSGDRHLALETLRTVTIRAEASGTPRALGLLARCNALLATDGEAEGFYAEAIERLGATSARSDLAHSHLLYGEWLRRRKLRTESREQLRLAHEMYQDMGITGFAERARLELAATGARARRRSVETTNDLTPQEHQIAKHAAAGDTNAEIAEKLFISARTVDYHLRKVFVKMGVSSRRDLRGRVD